MQTFCNTFSQIADLVIAISFLNLPIQFYLNNATNLHQLTSQKYDIISFNVEIVYRDQGSLYLCLGNDTK